jgi:Gas vesicle synthesis protein GvpL/GvpF
MYTYAFLKPLKVPFELPFGLVSPLELIISNKEVAALVEPELSLEDLKDNEERLMEAVLSHDRVLCEMFQKTTVLPLRFGTYFLSREILLEHLESQSDLYLQKLNYFEGNAEYLLKSIPREYSPEQLLPASETTEPASGRNYFLQKKRAYQLQQEYQQQQKQEWEELLTFFNRHYDTLLGEPQDGDAFGRYAIERLYLLVSRQEEFLLGERVQQWQLLTPHWELHLSNALPPYHFL